MRNLFVAVALSITVEIAFAAPQSAVTRAFAAKDSRVHILRESVGEVIVPPEKDQDGVQQVKVAPDGRTVGWLVNTWASCCVSYSIPVDLVIWRDGKIIRRFHARQLIVGWDFANGSGEVTFYTDVLHGGPDETCYRESIATGKELEAGPCEQ